MPDDRNHIEVYRDNAGGYRWTAYAGNGEIVSAMGRETGSPPLPPRLDDRQHQELMPGYRRGACGAASSSWSSSLPSLAALVMTR